MTNSTWVPGGLAAWQEARYSPVKLATAIEVLAEAGVAPPQLLQGLGLSPADLHNPDVLTSSAQLFEVLRRGAQSSRKPDIGLQIGLRLRVTGYGMYGYALLCAPTMGEALSLSMRYHALANPLLPLRSKVAGGSQLWVFPAASELSLPFLNERLYRLLVEMQMAIHHTLSRDVMGDWCRPSQLNFSWARPVHAALIQRSFDCPVHFGQAECDMRYPLGWLARAPQLANAISAAQTSRECARLLAALKGDTTMSRRVYNELMRRPGQFPDIEAVARGLSLTDRTLRRHLSREGTRFSDLLASVRRALAEDYLRSTRMSVEDIASALAYENVRSFRQAFTRWTGDSPSTFRRQARAGA